MNIIYQEIVSHSIVCLWGFLIILGVAGLIFAFSVMLEENWLAMIISTIVGIVFLTFGIIGVNLWAPQYMQYEIIVSSQEDLREMLDTYDFRLQKGQVYTVRDKEALD